MTEIDKNKEFISILNFNLITYTKILMIQLYINIEHNVHNVLYYELIKMYTSKN